MVRQASHASHVGLFRRFGQRRVSVVGLIRAISSPPYTPTVMLPFVGHTAS